VKLSKSQIDDLIVNYVIESTCPLSTVEKPAYRKLARGRAPYATLMTQKVLYFCVELKYVIMKTFLTELFHEIDYLHPTAGIWRTNNKSYIVVTAYRLDSDYVKKSVAIVSRRFIGTNDFSPFASHLNSINEYFSL